MKFINVKVIGDRITNEVYRRRDPAIPRGHPEYVMSRGELVDFSKCPKKWIKGVDEVETKATDYGSLLDTMILTPERLEKEYVVCPKVYIATGMECPSCGSITDSQKCSKCKCERHAIEIEKPWNNNATACEEWTAEQEKAGLTVVKSELYEEASKAIAAFKEDWRLMDLVEHSRHQVMIVATYVDEVTKIHVPLKVLLDIVPNPDHERYHSSLADLKTARSADFHQWDTAVGEHGYDVQAALYLAVFNAAHPDRPRTEWRYAIQENTAPYITARRTASEQQLMVGRAKLVAALKDYCVCLATNTWPAYDDYGDTYDGWKMSEPKEWQLTTMFGMGLKLPPKPENQQPGEDQGIIP